MDPDPILDFQIFIFIDIKTFQLTPPTRVSSQGDFFKAKRIVKNLDQLTRVAQKRGKSMAILVTSATWVQSQE